MIALLLATTLLQASPDTPEAFATLTVQSALKVSSASPIHLRSHTVNNPAIIKVGADANRVYRLQVQTYLPQAEGPPSATSATWADVTLVALRHVDDSGTDRVHIPDVDDYLQRTAAGVPLLPIRVIYE
ncbi:hypothetical protein [Brevundimonas vesicularis]|uniref:hypothetical protein n=1 Tax=Brevundimonas vesicularis TaxID=41276 RepID=UPI0038D3CB2D